MDRFARVKSVGARRKLDVTTICRCCGMLDDNKFSILGQTSDDEIEFQEKLSILTGNKV